MAESNKANVIVIGNEKGGSGKSTTAMHLIVALLRLGHSVGSIDVDTRQATLTRYIHNRTMFADGRGLSLPMPDHRTIDGEGDSGGEVLEERLGGVVNDLKSSHDVVVIDTPGTHNLLTRISHSFADTLITPLNDSLVDMDVLARVEGQGMQIVGPSHYAEVVWEQKKRRALRDGGSIDWIVLRNRLSSLDAHNRRLVGRLLEDLSTRIGFRMVVGFSERVVFRELFPRGLTMMDLRDVSEDYQLTPSHIAARQEVRSLVEAIRLP